MVSGWRLNHQDLAPSYASVLARFTAVIGTSARIISPIVSGLLTKKQFSIFHFLKFSLRIWSDGVMYLRSLLLFFTLPLYSI